MIVHTIVHVYFVLIFHDVPILTHDLFRCSLAWAVPVPRHPLRCRHGEVGACGACRSRRSRYVNCHDLSSTSMISMYRCNCHVESCVIYCYMIYWYGVVCLYLSQYVRSIIAMLVLLRLVIIHHLERQPRHVPFSFYIHLYTWSWS